MNKVLISVIVPVFNAEKYIGKCLASICMQSYQNIEILCVDDCSTDHSLEISYEFAEKDFRMKIYRQSENKGKCLALKRGVENACGSYVLFVDADDYLDLGLIEEIISVCDMEYDIVHFSSAIEDCGAGEGRVLEMIDFAAPFLGELIDEDVFIKCFCDNEYGFNTWNKMVRATLCRRVFSTIPDADIRKANDVFVYFPMSAYAKSYVGKNTNNKYHYCFGNGTTGKRVIDWVDFDKYCHYQDLIDVMRKMAQKHRWQINAKKTQFAIDNMEERLRKEAIEVWLFNVAESEKIQCFRELVKTCTWVEFSDLICYEFGEYKSTFANHIVKANIIQQNNAPTKKLAFYYKKYGQGGVERVISLLIPLLLKAGYGVVLITEIPEEKNDFILPSKVERYVIPSKSDIDAGKIRYKERGECLLRIYEEERIDTVIYEESSSRYLMYDMIVTKAAGVKFIISKHELFSQHFVFNRDILTDEIACYPLADAVTVLSEEEKVFWETMGVRSFLIPNPLTIEKKGFKCKVNSKEIVWIGRLDRNQKQYQEIVPIMKIVLESVPDATLKVYGSPETYKDLYLLKKQIAEERLESEIQYMGYSNSLEDMFSNACMMLMTSAYESSPMVVIEAKQFGIPIVMYTMPYIETLKDGKGYVAVEQGNRNAAAEAIIQLLKDKEYRKRLSMEASTSLDAYSNDDILEQWKELLSGNASGEKITETVYENILKTMIFHMSLGCTKCEDLARENRELKVSRKIEELKHVQVERKLKIALYPFGDLGRKLYGKLKNEQIDVSLIIDNAEHSDEYDIITLEELRKKNVADYFFIITSNNMKYYDEIRANLRKLVSERNIMDWYPVEE